MMRGGARTLDYVRAKSYAASLILHKEIKRRLIRYPNIMRKIVAVIDLQRRRRATLNPKRAGCTPLDNS
jgi:hypothetical protein